MAQDIPDPLFESARRAQALRLRRRRRARAQRPANKGAAIEVTWLDGHGSAESAGPGDPDRPGGSGGPGGSDPPGGVPGRLSPTQRIGSRYEDQALALLRQAGLRPLARNLRCRAGEIDLALRDVDTLVLVEVRARGDPNYGGAAASVGPDKQARLIRAACCLLPALAARHWGGRPPAVRFDVVAFDGETPCWLRHAFDVAMR
ncbi:YraN family protein [Bordetella genomosp. 9]|uniref:YraN family protein n=1 Tax=Bordetella genomosp. 9 TaxID=1416803 RepID=UPI000B9E9A1A|nr:YraN family protein [Bordetella genomosp. 9]